MMIRVIMVVAVATQSFVLVGRGAGPRHVMRMGLEGDAVDVVGARYEQALDALSQAERYEAVAMSVLAKGEVEEAMSILQEEPQSMTSRVARSLVETCVTNADAMTSAASKFRAKFSSYGCERATAPVADSGKRARFLASEDTTDVDARALEISAALGVLATAGSALMTIGVDSITGVDPTAPDAVLAAIAVAGGLDVWKNEGKLSGLVTSGITRLSIDDPRRQADAEAASFLVGYLLGIPAFAFKPTAFEALKLLTPDNNPFDPNTLLAWLSAPVAAESNKHRKFVVADPRQPMAAIKLAKDRGLFPDPDLPDVDRLKWATRDARAILRNHAQLHLKLTDRFEARSASPADCVALIEAWD